MPGNTSAYLRILANATGRAGLLVSACWIWLLLTIQIGRTKTALETSAAILSRCRRFNVFCLVQRKSGITILELPHVPGQFASYFASLCFAWVLKCALTLTIVPELTYAKTLDKKKKSHCFFGRFLGLFVFFKNQNEY